MVNVLFTKALMIKSYQFKRQFLWLFLPIILISSVIIVQSNQFQEYAELLSLAITLDLVIVFPFFYWLAIRKSSIPIISILPVFVFSIIVAGLILPAANQNYLAYLEYSLLPIELFLVGYLVFKVRQIRKAYSNTKTEDLGFPETLKLSLENSFGKTKANEFFQTEVSLFYYAFGAWNVKPEIPPKATAFTIYKKSAYGTVIAVFVFVMLLETIILHIVLAKWSLVLAWILTSLSIYGIFFLFGDFNAIRSRPVLVTNQKLIIRTGIRWFLEVDLSNIESLKFSPSIAELSKKRLKTEVLGSANVLLQLKKPVIANTYYGIKKETKTVSLFVDELERFRSLINAYIQKTRS